ncbi:MAG: alpha-hydroxy-acid oxidizing protein [Thermodesulfovibrio sp.]|jgi:isopentenyl diphosphate isomerase/L-lactate dehydrogenase-like FMN-dependent dehydrogenase|uniref:alpha-hydroxy-acid oxidizing protein n=1 Tax=unclassified Thermodesulfovibrio TaxID=2645936 RepID=UPI00083A8A0B|nr:MULTISPECIES: alpha-hydroxy-acid oxidizing protein [unclassified Thermodesulfovibrio]MDI1472645.1 alpha-hydroxy-acid oxidizing protein [Thermodesulfovibrio sp. 1176]MDI6714819.1 alpha-hydroxy-acid oxidizing protein [Thermodesulfovibrio sp.]ODA43311.1 L-lactate dehydrogenase [Thermodesulfovibrio sp. N1]
MNWQEVKKIAKEKLKPYCRVCPICNGVACAGEVPGMGGVGTGSSFKANVEALNRIKLNLSTIHDVRQPDTEIEIFGQKLSLPVMSAPITGTTYNMGGAITEDVYTQEVIAGSIMAGTIGWTGDGADPLMYGSGIDAIKKNDGKGIPIIKPRAQDEIIKRIRLAEEAKALAVGVDIDGAGLVTMALRGQPVSPKSPKEIEELVKSTKLPFILKGIMTLKEAEIAYNLGVSAIVVSNHGGRILDHTPGVAEVLPEIADKLKGKITIIADGGVRSGVDVLKLLALGADAVLIGRPIVVAVFGGGRDALKLYFETIKNELKQAMLLTGVDSVKNVPKEILR